MPEWLGEGSQRARMPHSKQLLLSVTGVTDAAQQATTRQKTILNFFPTHVEPKAPSTRQCSAISAKYLYPTLHTKAGKFEREEFSSTKLGTVGRVPRRTGKRSRCCGFAEMLGLYRVELSGTNIGFRDFKMTAWSFQTSLTKWGALTRPGW